ncbi:hypothetical protein H6F77_21105 [Microcoleus sp. FACHB-831]|uniref:hypothetical protein n=1 Tax=Microcoleus sp. FACHB-831 TaxID=2692827 RepID=UPI0016872C14|nr:hypothetical protein [Microcoleus sp. FACHB-831]MBD1923550.1 hypothetical protein [Microcoleus sp. FACHB-831]
MTIQPFWVNVNEPTLRQGDYLPQCLVPVFGPNFDGDTDIQDVQVNEFDLIIVTQSCDLENKKARLVAMIPIYPISEFEKINPAFAKKGRWNDVLKGRVEGLHMLASPTNPANNREALVVDFREIYSLPYDYLVKHSTELGSRWRLRSPFLEHFSQTFARFFMRVGLPSTIPEFK